MNVALLISGYLRSFKLNIENIKEKIINKFDNVDVYIHVTKNESINDKYLNYTNDLDFIIKELNPILLYEDEIELNPDKKTNDVLNSWLKLYKLNSLKCINELNKPYDLVIKYRPDLNIISDDIFPTIIEDDFIYIPKDSKIDINKLVNSSDEYICDIFAFGKSNVMNTYFSLYEHINFLINKYNTNISETLLIKHLQHFGINIKFIDIDYNVILSNCNIFSITGDSGSGKTTLSNIIKKHFYNSFLLECDRYHKWERNDKNWEKFTHLNPEANLISKMNSDIFDLKIGKQIYHVDYDHKSGKFTDQETIEPSDNIIVCGLHNLYGNTNNLYNLKIFIDTDDVLKNSWKINRDINERGYTLDKCLEQIKNRNDDYDKYIKPQRNNADIIIRFFIVGENQISLQININKKYNVVDLIKELDIHKIVYKNFIQDDSYVIIFNEYVEDNLIDFKNIKKENNYYDYVLFIIHKLIN